MSTTTPEALFMNMLTSLFKDDKSSGNERLHYSWLRDDFPESEYIVYPNVALQVIIDSEYPAVNEQLDDGKAWVMDPDPAPAEPAPWSCSLTAGYSESM